MKKPILLFLTVLLLSIAVIPSHAQLEANNWYWGGGKGVQFLPTLKQLDSVYDNGEEAIAISDRQSGKLLFTSAFDIANLGVIGAKITHHVDLFDGSNVKFTPLPLRGDVSCSQGLLVVPHPSNCSQYYILSLDSRFASNTSRDNKYQTQLSYSLVEYSFGLWKVVVKDAPIIQGYFTEGMTGTIHSNGHDFWVVLFRYNPLSFVSIPITEDGINAGNAVFSYPDQLPDKGDAYNHLKLSPDGKHLLDLASYNLCLSDFNSTTGIISNRKDLGIYGIPFTFSPDNSKIYTLIERFVPPNGSSPRVIQIDITDSILVPSPIDTVQEPWNRGAASMQIAPDGKIYFQTEPNWTQLSGPPKISYLSCIEEPNKKGNSCKLNIKKLVMRQIDGGAFDQFPNYMDYIFNTDGVLGAEQLAARCSPPRALVLPDSGCIGSTLVFTDMSKYATRRTWKFENGSPGSSTDSIVSVTYSKAGTYKVILTVENDNGTASDTTYAIIYPNPTANAGSDKTICPNSSAQIGDKPEAGNTYTWLPTTDLDDPNIANPNASPKTTTQYILTVTSEHGCIAYDTVLVTVGNIVAKVSNDTTICSGSSVQLLASGGAKYTWSSSIGLSDSTIENPIASPNKTTTYKILVSSGTCEDSAFVTITVNPQPTANAGQDKTLCIGASTEIGETAQAGFTYSWQPTTGLDDATKANPTASPTSSTQYILNVTGNGGCSASDTALVTIGTIKAIVSNDTSICEGASVQLVASGGTKYEWSPSIGLDNPSIANPIANPTNTTKYKVLVSSGTCIDSAYITVTILPPPNTNAGEDKSICNGESTQIGTPAEAGNTYAWSPSTGLLSPFTSQSSASPTTTTTYNLKVINPAGCVKSDEVIVIVNPKNERSFTLKPDTVSILPGKQFTTFLNIPNGVTDWSVKLFYDPLLITYNSISEGQAFPEDLKGELLVRGNGGSRSFSINFDAFLPHTSDTIYPVRLTVDSSNVATCETWSAVGNILMLADYCGKNIRVVSSTGKKYFLTVKYKSIDFGVGLSGNVHLEVFDYVGNSVLVVSDGALEAGEYSAALDLPVGVYYCRFRAGLYEQVGKVLVRF
ncbi:MAG: PKD domain-containing protein [Ignavibacteria bacterium]|nr:PKD domain-containing protein [Ignavibacteria bacterium]